MAVVVRILPRHWDGHRLLRFLTGLAMLALALTGPSPAAATGASPHPASAPPHPASASATPASAAAALATPASAGVVPEALPPGTSSPVGASVPAGTAPAGATPVGAAPAGAASAEAGPVDAASAEVTDASDTAAPTIAAPAWAALVAPRTLAEAVPAALTALPAGTPARAFSSRGPPPRHPLR